MRTRAILVPLHSAGVAPSTALFYPPSHNLADDGRFLGTSAHRKGVSKGCEKVSTGSDLCRPWREETGHEIDQAARVPSVRVFVGDEVGDREANETTRPYQRSKQRLRVLPTEPVGQRVGDSRHLRLVEDVHVEVHPEVSSLRLEPLGDVAPQPFGIPALDLWRFDQLDPLVYQ